MTYSSVAQVQSLIPTFTISPQSVPTLAQVGLLIDDISDEIDATLAGRGVTVPVTTPSYFLRHLALLNAYGSAAAVLKAAYPEATGPGQNPAYAFWESRYRDGLKALASGAGIPTEIVVTGESSSEVGPSSLFTKYPEGIDPLDTAAVEGGPSLFSVGRDW